MLDCACLAGVAALRHYRRPEVEVIGEEVIIVRTTLLFPSLITQLLFLMILLFLASIDSTIQQNVRQSHSRFIIHQYV